jgi:hypothetical protein
LEDIAAFALDRITGARGADAYFFGIHSLAVF